MHFLEKYKNVLLHVAMYIWKWIGFKPLLYVNITFMSYYAIYLVNPSSCMYMKQNCICILNLITQNNEGLTL